MIDAMPDIVPIVDAVPALPGLTLAAGMSGHGFGIGPGFGRVIARRLLGEPDEHDLSRFRFGRFTDGSRLRPGPSL
jgi:glycine/D-amino acid oxidase-like deaminating enzyme